MRAACGDAPARVDGAAASRTGRRGGDLLVLRARLCRRRAAFNSTTAWPVDRAGAMGRQPDRRRPRHARRLRRRDARRTTLRRRRCRRGEHRHRQPDVCAVAVAETAMRSACASAIASSAGQAGGRRVVRDRRRRPRFSALSTGAQPRHAGRRLSPGQSRDGQPGRCCPCDSTATCRPASAVASGRSAPRSIRRCRCASALPLSDYYDQTARLLALHRLGHRTGDAERAAALGRGHVRVDVVHRRATHARDRHPRRAWRASGTPARQRLRHASLRQLAIGIVVGSMVSGLAISIADLNPALATGLLLAVATIMLAVGLLAAVGPARRSLRIHASDALRTDH